MPMIKSAVPAVQERKRITVVIPVYNNEQILIPSYDRLATFFSNHVNDFEILIVNDGSTDNTKQILDNLAISDSRLRVVHLSRNHGQQIALGAGLEKVMTEVAVTTDIDLPVALNDLLELVKKLEDGYSLVLGKRDKTPHQVYYRKWGSRVMNFLVQVLFSRQITDFGCSCGAVSTDLLQRLRKDDSPRWSLKLTLVLLADKFCEITVHTAEQRASRSSYSLRKLIMLALSIIVYRFFMPGHKNFVSKKGTDQILK